MIWIQPKIVLSAEVGVFMICTSANTIGEQGGYSESCSDRNRRCVRLCNNMLREVAPFPIRGIVGDSEVCMANGPEGGWEAMV